MRADVPPPGRQIVFDEWAVAIVDAVRAFMPAAQATRRGFRHVVIRHDAARRSSATMAP
jgi:hypothetical protein